MFILRFKKIIMLYRATNYYSISIYILLILSLSLIGCSKDMDKKNLTHTKIKKDYFRALNEDSEKLFDILNGETTGVKFNNKVSLNSEFFNFNNYFNGGGVGVGDINNDGLPDLYFSANKGPNALYLNKGDLQFEDISSKSNLDQFNGEWTTGVTMVDINNDGWMDIYVCCSNNVDSPELRSNLFFINQGDMTFKEMGKAMNVADTSFSTHAAFLDYDNDGDLDLYVLNHPIDFNDRRKINNHEKIELGTNKSDHLYKNNGNMTFTDVSLEAGINNHGFGLSVNTCDFNNDGWIDLFTTNDWGLQDQYYINQKDGTFLDMSLSKFTKQSFSSMGSVITDFNNDGHPDIFVSEMESEDLSTHKSYAHAKATLGFYRKMHLANYHHQFFRNALHINNGDGTYTERARASNVASSDWSWSALSADFDNDGWKDLFVANGFPQRAELDKRPIMAKFKAEFRRKKALGIESFIASGGILDFQSINRVYRNNKDLTFTDNTYNWGTNYNTASYGALIVDLDLDGDLDIVSNNMNDEAFIYRNNYDRMSDVNNYLRISLKQEGYNSDAINARIDIYSQGANQCQYISSTKGYLSSSEKVAHFGLDTHTKVDSIIITWPDNSYEKFNIDKINRQIELKKGSGERILIRNQNLIIQSFDEVFVKNKILHKENKYDDFRKDQLKPRYHSTIGPAIAVSDINGDGIDDFYVSAASGSKGQFYSLIKGEIEKIGYLSIDKEIEETGVLLFDADNDADIDMYICSGDINKDEGNDALSDYLMINDGKGNFTRDNKSLPNIKSVTSTVTGADVDRDGDIDLFVGSRYLKNEYPLIGKSALLINTNGKFEDATEKWKFDLSGIGMISSSLWTDIDQDGDQDLIIIGEWSNINVFENTGNSLINISTNLGLEKTGGWWNSITGADLDKDGDIDYLLGNQGNNIKYKPKEDEPLKIYHGKFDKNNDEDFVISHYYEGKEYPVHFLEDLGKEYSFIRKRYKSYNKFALTTTEELVGPERIARGQIHSADIFESIILWNDNGKFRIQNLPNEVQASVVNGIIAEDFNEDGHLDILLQGNLFDFLPQYERQDGIMGLYLLGNSKGQFKVENYVKSGFEVKGENRGLAILNLNDEKYILNGVNNDRLKIFKLKGQNDCVTIKLNHDEFALDIVYKDGSKERKEIYYGDSYLSQSSRTKCIDTTNISSAHAINYNGNIRKLFD